MLFRAARPETFTIVHLDSFTLVYHRASGITHMLTAPAPEILGVLGEAGRNLAGLGVALRAQYDIADLDDAALAMRLDELVTAGLVELT